MPHWSVASDASVVKLLDVKLTIKLASLPRWMLAPEPGGTLTAFHCISRLLLHLVCEGLLRVDNGDIFVIACQHAERFLVVAHCFAELRRLHIGLTVTARNQA